MPDDARGEVRPPADAVPPAVLTAVRDTTCDRPGVVAAYLFARAGSPRLLLGVHLAPGMPPGEVLPGVLAELAAALPADSALGVLALSRRMLAEVRRHVPPV